MKKEIIIKEIRLLNFKGLKNQVIEFTDTTSIFGDNGTGKSTIFDAFTWLLFGKDSNDRKDFEVKTLDANNRPIPKIEHEVSAVLLINGSPLTLKRTLREKWVKKRGSADTEFTGNETLYEWNDVPVKAGEFQQKLSAIVDEVIFKLITNPMAFASLNWKEQRQVLIEMCGDVDLETLASGNSEYEGIVQEIASKNIDLEEYRKSISARKKKIKVELDAIPTRIDEVQLGKPIPLRFDQIRKQIAEKTAALQDVEAKISDKSKAVESLLNQRAEQQKKIYEIKTELSNLKHGAERKANQALIVDTSKMEELERKLTSLKNTLSDYEKEVGRIEEKIAQQEKQIEAKREEFIEENSQELSFNDEDFHCPTCKREFESGDVEVKKAEMLQNFKYKKTAKLAQINREGKQLSEYLEENKYELNKYLSTIATKKAEIEKTKEAFELEADQIKEIESGAENEADLIEQFLKETNFSDLHKKQAELEKALVEVPEVDTKNLKAQKSGIANEIDQLKKDLSTEEEIKKAYNRIKELEAEEEKYSAQLMEIEGKEFAVENLIKLNIESLEEKINAHFKFVNFKLFSEQINGGVVETCEALIDGVPFSNANTASRINAGLDIINSLCEYYGVTAPVFLDNRESVVSLIDTDSQIINLIVSEADKKLRVEAGKLQKEVA